MKKIILTIVFLFSCYWFALAQDKLPNVQEVSYRAPAGIHIDGNLSDWKDTLKAYNKSTKLYYLLANDDRFLYLAAKSTDATNIAKLGAGGITLTINTAGKKKDKDAYVLTYPLITRQAGRGRRGFSAPDSAARQQLISSAKEIKVIGFKEVDDTIISIYNEYSIKAAINFDAKGNYCWELAVPLKMLGLSADQATEIACHITVNGLQIAARNLDLVKVGADNGNGAVDVGGFRSSGGGGGGGRRGGRGGNGNGGGTGGGRNNIDFADLTSPTDFWGKYTLAKQ